MSSPSGGGSSNTTTKQEIDPWMKQQIQDNMNYVDAIASQPFQQYQGQGVAPLNSDLRGMLGGIMGMAQANPYADQMTAGMQGANDLMKWGQNPDLEQMTPYEREQFQMQTQAEARPEFQTDQVNVYNSLDQQAGYNPEQVNLAELDMAQFMNPYTNDVVNSALNDIDRSRQMAVNQTQDQSISAGAFAGSRAALADAATNREYADAAGSTAGQLRNQGFNTALQAAQNQQGMDMQAQGMNQQAGLNARQMNNADRLGTQQLNQQGFYQAAGLNQQGQLASEQLNQANSQWAQNANMQNELAQQQINESGNLAAHQLNQQGLMDFQSQRLDAQRLGLLGAQGLMSGAQGANQMVMGNLGAGVQAGGVLQGNQQAQEDFNYQQYLREQQYPMQMAQLRTSALHGMPMLGGSTSQSGGGGSSFGNALGGAASGAGMGGMLAGMSGGAMGGPMGMAIGGGLGLLGGMFG